MALISVLSLRSPENAARAIEAGAGELAIQAMQNFPTAPLLQRNCCLMIRNLVVRNSENRLVFVLVERSLLLSQHYLKNTHTYAVMQNKLA